MSTLSRAVTIGEGATVDNDPNFVNKRQELYDRVSKADLQRVARTYLKETNRTVINTTPKPRTPARPSQ